MFGSPLSIAGGLHNALLEAKRLRCEALGIDRLAVCLDTAHMLAAGYDLTSAQGALATLQEFDHVVGLAVVRVVHVNDSKTPRGSRCDRHEHIGKGHVARAALQAIITHPRFAEVPKIIETPKDGQAPDGREWDRVNLAALRRLVRMGRPRGG